MYKSGLELFIADWLSQNNHIENKDEEIHDMDVPQCMSIQQIQQAPTKDEHLQWLKGYIIAGWPEIKSQVQEDIRAYWSFKDDMAVNDGIIMKGRHVIIPEILKTQVLDNVTSITWE